MSEAEAATLNSLGYVEHHTGHYRAAIDHSQQALTLFRDIGHIFHIANTLDTLGHSYAALRRRDQARTAWWEALELYRQQGRDETVTQIQRQLDDLDGPDWADG